MENNKISYTMIKSAVEKGIKDIHENPRRGIRNLVDLGGMFSGGRFQKDFFEVAHSELQNEESVYYKLTEKIVKETNPKILSSFGINLGYHSWTQGAKIIREVEAEKGFNVPWCVLFEMGYGEYLAMDLISNVIEQGKALGIYTYMFYLDECYPALSDLLDLFDRHADCAFVLFLSSFLVKNENAEKLTKAKNSMIVIDMDSKDSAQKDEAISMLKQEQCLLGGFSRYSELESHIDICISETHKHGLPFLFLIGTKRYGQDLTNVQQQTLLALRRNLSMPVFPIDLYPDIANIDRNISTEECLTVILGNGTVLTTDMSQEQVNTGHNIRQESLQAILSETMPKRVE